MTYFHSYVFYVNLINVPSNVSDKTPDSSRSPLSGRGSPLSSSPSVVAAGREVLKTWPDIQAFICFAAPLNPHSVQSQKRFT